jgi:hypothetical protein
MREISIYFNKTEIGFEVALGDGPKLFYPTRREAWEVVNNSVKDFDFTNDKLLFNGIEIPSMERLVSLVRYLF